MSVLCAIAHVDFHPTHHFDAREDKRINFRREGGDVMQYAVDTVAQADAVFLRFKVNITGIHL